MCAGDDMIAVHGRMYTMAVTSSSGPQITVGAYIGGPPELNAGDTIALYSPTGQPFGSVTVKSVTSVPQPSNVNPSAPNTVFGGTFAGYIWLKVSCSPASPAPTTEWAPVSCTVSSEEARDEYSRVGGMLLQLVLNSYPSAYSTAPFNSFITVPSRRCSPGTRSPISVHIDSSVVHTCVGNPAWLLCTLAGQLC